MKDPVLFLDRLAKKAQDEKTPAIAIASSVMRRMRLESAPDERPVMIFAACSCSLAAGVVAYCLSWINLLTDPMGMMIQVFPTLWT